MTTGGGTLGRAVLELEADLGGLKRDLNTAERLAKERAKAISRSFRKVGIGLLAAGAGITAVFGFAVKSAANFEQTMANVLAVSGATEEEFQALNNIAREMGRTTAFTATQAAEALSFMSRAGLEVRESIAALPDTLNLAAAGQLELGDAADIVTNVMAGYGIAADDLTRAVDVLTTGFTSANTDLLQLGEAFKLGGPVAKAAGLQFEETAAALALMGNTGFQGSLAGTALRGAFTHLLNPTAEAASLLASLGVEATDSTGELLSLHEIVAQFEKASLSAGDAMLIFGQRAGPAMLALVGQGSEALRELTHEMENSGGTAAEIARIQLDTFNGQMLLLRSAFEGVSIEIGKIFIPIIRSVAKFITPIIQAFSVWTEQNPLLAKVIFIVVGAVGILLVAIGAILILISLMIPALIVLQGTFLATWAAALLPILPVIAAIAALALIGVVLWKNWETIKQKAIQIWGAIKDTIKKNWDIILAILFPGVGIAVLIARRWGAIKNVITGILNSVTSTVLDWMGTIKEWLLSLFGPKLFGQVFGKLRELLDQVKDNIVGFFRRPLDVVLDFVLDFDWKKLIPPMPKWEWSGWKDFFWPFSDLSVWLWGRFKWSGWKDFFWPFSDLSVWLWGRFKWPGWKDFFWPFSDLSVWLWGKFKWPGWKDFFWPFSDLSVWLWGRFKWPGWKDFFWPFSDLSVWLWGRFKWSGWKDFSWPFSDLSVWLWGRFKWSGWKDFFWPFSDLSVWLWGRFKWPGWKDFFWPFSDLSVWLWGKFKWPGWKDFFWPFSDLSVWLWGRFKWPGWKDFFWPFSDLSVWLWGRFKWPGWKDFFWPFSDLSVWLWGRFKWPGWKDFFWPFSDLSVWLWGKFKWPGWKDFSWPFSAIPNLDPRDWNWDPRDWVRDTGGIVTSPQLAALAMNSRPEAIIPLDRLHEFIGNGGGGLTVNVHVSGDVNGVEKLREIIRQGILDGDRRGLEHAF